MQLLGKVRMKPFVLEYFRSWISFAFVGKAFASSLFKAANVRTLFSYV